MPGGRCRTRKRPEREYILYQTDRQTERGVQRRANWLWETLMGQRKFRGGAIGRASPCPTRAVLWGNSSTGTPCPRCPWGAHSPDSPEDGRFFPCNLFQLSLPHQGCGWTAEEYISWEKAVINISHFFYLHLPLMNSQCSAVQAITVSPIINFLRGRYKSHWTQSLSFFEISVTWYDQPNTVMYALRTWTMI